MAQFIYTMNRVGKVVPPKRIILRDITLSFFPGAKIGVLGLNGSGKSTLLKIMSGMDKEIEGEARPQAGIKVGDAFEIFEPGEALIDPATGANLGAPEKHTGSGVVTEVQDKYSIIKITSGTVSAKSIIRAK